MGQILTTYYRKKTIRTITNPIDEKEFQEQLLIIDERLAEVLGEPFIPYEIYRWDSIIKRLVIYSRSVQLLSRIQLCKIISYQQHWPDHIYLATIDLINKRYVPLIHNEGKEESTTEEKTEGMERLNDIEICPEERNPFKFFGNSAASLGALVVSQDYIDCKFD